MGKFQQQLEAEVDAAEDRYWEVCTTHLKWWPCLVKHDKEKDCRMSSRSEARNIVTEFHAGTLTRAQAKAEMFDTLGGWADA